MITAIIVDDEILQLNSLENMLKRYCPNINILAACNKAIDAIEKINQLKPQLLLLDISMPDKDGFELLKAINYKEKEVIFITAHNAYMQQAFKYSAMDYLLKPVDEEDLIEAVNRASIKILENPVGKNLDTLLHNLSQNVKSNNTDLKICLPTHNGFIVIELNDIIYCQAEGSYTEFILTNNKKILASKPLIEYDDLLSTNHFVRVHRSYLINMKHVKQYFKGEGGMVTMSNNDTVEVSRRRKEHFLEVVSTVYKQ